NEIANFPINEHWRWRTSVTIGLIASNVLLDGPSCTHLYCKPVQPSLKMEGVMRQRILLFTFVLATAAVAVGAEDHTAPNSTATCGPLVSNQESLPFPSLPISSRTYVLSATLCTGTLRKVPTHPASHIRKLMESASRPPVWC